MTSFRIRVGIVCGIMLGFVLYFMCFSAPFSAPQKLLLQVHSGETGHDIAHDLSMQNAIRSQTLFRILLRLYGDDTRTRSGTYYFSEPENAFTIAWHLHTGDFNVEPVRVVIPEGTNTKEMAAILGADVAAFNEPAFLEMAAAKEGYLFPDTYFFYPGATADDVIRTMGANFDAKVADPAVLVTLKASGKPLSQIITMASILEKEAPDLNNRQIIAGILWKRIKLGMPLQVDAVFPYITGKTTGTITHEDLSVDSPYNTYTHTGLPPGPITNPGLDSILAAATPTTTPYLYYLSDKEGNFHYSSSYAGQLANQKKYIK